MNSIVKENYKMATKKKGLDSYLGNFVKNFIHIIRIPDKWVFRRFRDRYLWILYPNQHKTDPTLTKRVRCGEVPGQYHQQQIRKNNH